MRPPAHKLLRLNLLNKNACPLPQFPAYLASVRGPVYLALATTSLLVISSTGAHAQAPSTLHFTSSEPETKYEPVQVITKERTQAITKEKTSERKLPVAHYRYVTPAGKRESAPVITQYYPKRIVYPVAKVDRHIDRKLMQAATIAQERAHAHSRSMCWHYVKEALLASGVIDSRPKSEFAKDAA